MSTARRLNYSYADYLQALELSPLKLEYWAGEILAMAGGTPEHEALVAAVMLALGSRLPAGCRPFGSNMKVKIREFTLLPDASVVCGKLARAADDETAVVNPSLVIEVTSQSTEAFDRGAKLERYKLLKPLRSIWIVSHAAPRVTVIERAGKSWRSSERGPGERLTLDSPPLTVDVDELYAVLDGL